MAWPLATLPSWPSAELQLRRVEAKDVKICAELEAASYPSDEAASPENLALRQRVAGDYFWAAVDSGSQKSWAVFFVYILSLRKSAFDDEALDRT
eukprot:s5085_g1.t1